MEKVQDFAVISSVEIKVKDTVNWFSYPLCLSVESAPNRYELETDYTF